MGGLHDVCATQGCQIAILEAEKRDLERRVLDIESYGAGGVDIEEVRGRVALLGSVMGLKVDRSEVTLTLTLTLILKVDRSEVTTLLEKVECKPKLNLSPNPNPDVR